MKKKSKKKRTRSNNKRKNKDSDDSFESFESSATESEEEDESESDSEDYTSENSAEDTLSSAVTESSAESDMDNYYDNHQKGNLKRKRSKKSVKKPSKKKKLEFGSDEASKHCEALRDQLLSKFNEIKDRLPPNTLDELIDKLGGPSEVAEMTGRKGRMVMTEDGQVVYESRKDDSSLEMMNIVEKDKFMSGEKEIAIISDAASSGISLQSDKRVSNQKRRVHITIELPWSADKAIQQFGRTHRSNQANAPKYIFMISELSGEQRFASTVAKRLESLGALTHGDRRATESRDLSKFNLECKYSTQALQTVLNILQGYEKTTVPFPADYEGDFFKDCRDGMVGVGLLTYNEQVGSYFVDKDDVKLTKFLNRLLGMPVKIQNALFNYFYETMDTYIQYAKRTGKYDQGIMDLTSSNCKMERLEHKKFVNKNDGMKTTIELHKIAVDRRISWDKALEMLGDSPDDLEGFWDITPSIYARNLVALVIKDQSKTYEKAYYRAYKPNIGIESKSMSANELKNRGRKIKDLGKAKDYWEDLYNLCEKYCSHFQYFNSCKRINTGLTCDSGMKKMFYILSGSVLKIWSKIENILYNNKLQIVRLSTEEGLRCVGVEIPSGNINTLIRILEEDNEIVENNEQLKPEIKPKTESFDEETDIDEDEIECLD